MSLKLAFIDRAPISGTPYYRWHYRLSWDTPKASVPDHYVVQPRDTLWAIAGKFLGNPRQWPRIWHLNKGLIDNPDLIFPGQSLAIPDGVGLESEVALGFDSRIDIRDPDAFDKVLLSGHQKPAGARLQFVTATRPTALGTTAIDFFFAAPGAVDPTRVYVFTSAGGSVGWQDPLPFDTDSGSDTVPGPAIAATAVGANGSHAGTNGGGTGESTGTVGVPVANFRGVLPYASEVFGVYQPLAGWLGQQSGGVLSPIGLVTLYREYFFEFDNFLGAPSGHIWISPGGSVEVIESSTRRTLVERTAAQSEEVTSKVEESLTNQDDIADAVKEDNANDTKLGASASAGGKFAGVYHADASASFSNQTTKKARS